MKKTLLFIAFGALLLTSCKRYSCECTTDYYDSYGYYINSTTTNEKVKGFTSIKASSECASKNNSTGYSETYCYLN